MSCSNKKGLLLVNLGTPDSAHPKDVFRYLNEFLTDGRVIDISWLKRQLLVRGIIVPTRFRQSAKLYQKIWLKEGSPLLVHGHAVRDQLQNRLGEGYQVELAMRYQKPSIDSVLKKFAASNLEELTIFPLFPQYASATTGSVHQKIMDSLSKWTVIPKLNFINSYPDHPALIHAFCERAKHYPLEDFDHVLFSFHGLPERQIRAADKCGRCLKGQCCETLKGSNLYCYQAQCNATARAIAKQLNLKKDDYTICFQSRLGSDPWIQPYTTDCLKQCIDRKQKRVLVFCPAFVCDCLETTCEISIEYAHLFKEMGGERLQLVEGLNSHPAWIDAIVEIAKT